MKTQTQIHMSLHRLADLLLSALAFRLAFWIKTDHLPLAYRGLLQGPDYNALLLLIIAIWYLSFWSQGVYDTRDSSSPGRILWKCFKAISIGMLVLAMSLYAFKIENISRLLIGLFYLLNIVLVLGTKTIFYRMMITWQEARHRHMVILGCNQSVREILEAAASEDVTGYKVAACLDTKSSPADITDGDIRMLDTHADLERILLTEKVDDLVLTTDGEKPSELERYVRLADEMGVAVHILPQWHIRRLSRIPRIGNLRCERFLGLPALGIDNTPASRGELVCKTLFDYSIATAGLLLTLPLWLLAAAVIKFVSPEGPVFYQQTRVGKNGRAFTLIKFRTMIPDADRYLPCFETQNECDGPVFKMRADPRILPGIGTLLRKTSLDELPQLINVLRGELSIVGPRPPRPREVKCYQHWQRRRLSMKPGLTCFWQIQPNRNDIGFNDWMKMDLAYIDNWSLWLDLKIMMWTARAMVTGSGR